MDLARLVCRPALPQDTAAILELTRHIWEGHDYIPMVWGDWLGDEQGQLVVAQLGSRIVGMGKLTKISNGEWWLEGLRVHPEFERRGIAAHIQTFLLAAWYKIGNGAIRLATNSQRLAVHRICQRTGFKKVAELSSFSANAIPLDPRKALSVDQKDFIRLSREDLDDARKFVKNNPLQKYGGSFVDLGWQWLPLPGENLAHFLQTQSAYWWQHRQGLLLLGEDNDEESGELFGLIRWLGCELADLARFLYDVRILVGRLGYQKASWIAPIHPAVKAALKAAGFENDWDFSLYLFEKWYNPAEIEHFARFSESLRENKLERTKSGEVA